jgi:hypothetical protein
VTVDNRFVITPNIPGLTLSLEVVASGVSIGGLDETDVSFANFVSTGVKSVAGITGFIEFDSKSQTSAVVNKEESVFVWKVNKIKLGGNEKTNGIGVMTTTDSITFYTVLDVPKEPWSVANKTESYYDINNILVTTTDNKMQSWVDVLDVIRSGQYCQGMDRLASVGNIKGTTDKITEELNARFKYDSWRYAHYITPTEVNIGWSFNLTSL